MPVQKAMLGAGCFWGVEESFRTLPGVIKTSVGYSGGNLDNPTYKQVCTDTTGHAEVVLIEFDDNAISYEELLEVFFRIHDPTTLNRQGPDFGSQYRSVIFTFTEEQHKIAVKSVEKINSELKFGRPVVTKIQTAGNFFPAEEYHQQYLAKQGKKSCH